jgi:hypothetical protein
MEYEGALYHVTARGDHQNPIYKDERIGERFSGSRDVVERFGGRCPSSTP